MSSTSKTKQILQSRIKALSHSIKNVDPIQQPSQTSKVQTLNPYKPAKVIVTSSRKQESPTLKPFSLQLTSDDQLHLSNRIQEIEKQVSQMSLSYQLNPNNSRGTTNSNINQAENKQKQCEASIQVSSEEQQFAELTESQIQDSSVKKKINKSMANQLTVDQNLEMYKHMQRKKYEEEINKEYELLLLKRQRIKEQEKEITQKELQQIDNTMKAEREKYEQNRNNIEKQYQYDVERKLIQQQLIQQERDSDLEKHIQQLERMLEEEQDRQNAQVLKELRNETIIRKRVEKNRQKIQKREEDYKNYLIEQEKSKLEQEQKKIKEKLEQELISTMTDFERQKYHEKQQIELIKQRGLTLQLSFSKNSFVNQQQSGRNQGVQLSEIISQQAELNQKQTEMNQCNDSSAIIELTTNSGLIANSITNPDSVSVEKVSTELQPDDQIELNKCDAQSKHENEQIDQQNDNIIVEQPEIAGQQQPDNCDEKQTDGDLTNAYEHIRQQSNQNELMKEQLEEAEEQQAESEQIKEMMNEEKKTANQTSLYSFIASTAQPELNTMETQPEQQHPTEKYNELEEKHQQDEDVDCQVITDQQCAPVQQVVDSKNNAYEFLNNQTDLIAQKEETLEQKTDENEHYDTEETQENEIEDEPQRAIDPDPLFIENRYQKFDDFVADLNESYKHVDQQQNLKLYDFLTEQNVNFKFELIESNYQEVIQEMLKGVKQAINELNQYSINKEYYQKIEEFMCMVADKLSQIQTFNGISEFRDKLMEYLSSITL